ncbi:hypothetical protein PHMEG_00013226 [Phytophthora megakarya]|uniref:Uncharacterized protein n=1 Tax=Phytophthora megakarya TaxID=4795 RepID=A0A225W7S2_9STRA|nr:hypothetical protein PHMEG_00013226 [Phytophthora megakarya]
MLKELDPCIKEEELDTPVLNQTFGSNWVSAHKKVKLHLLIHTAAGPVEPVQAVDVFIVDADDSEFIVGNDLQTTLGIDVEGQLAMLANRGEDETSGDSIELEADENPAANCLLPVLTNQVMTIFLLPWNVLLTGLWTTGFR